jgi:hypothetical protein
LPYCVAVLWADEGARGAAIESTWVLREHALPTGAMHIVVRLGTQPLRVYVRAGDPAGRR